MGPEHQLSRDFQNHAITAKTYADDNERIADVAWQKTENVNKVVRIMATNAYKILLSVGPSVWITIAGGNLGNILTSDISAGNISADAYAVKALQTAPSSATDTGTAGEIRWTATHVYFCTATDTWVRAALITW